MAFSACSQKCYFPLVNGPVLDNIIPKYLNSLSLSITSSRTQNTISLYMYSKMLSLVLVAPFRRKSAYASYEISDMLATYILPWNTPKRAFYCLNVSMNRKSCYKNIVQRVYVKTIIQKYNYSKLSWYDLASALATDDVAHPFKRPHQGPGDDNGLYNCTTHVHMYHLLSR